MKIKRFSNLWYMGIVLCSVIIGLIYLFKIFFPTFVIEVSHTESILAIGHYIDTHKWAWYLASSIMSLFLYYFLCCACSGRKSLSTKEIAIIVVIFTFGYVLREFANEYYMTFNFISMIIAPCLCNGKMRNTTVCVSLLMLLQVFTLSIRNLSLLISDANFATLMVLMIDYYILCVLLYFLFNNKEE
jgi:hypothetical protein